ncbi:MULTISPECIES: winged helix-turn-helix domain-containing protein [unclassified Enterococcus]|uniref:winged helix-turn-helix domain-containing protein n=1 Tax=unclassified Enterococcus TaxID=2608891 RepID=UPI001CE06FAC|nr:MULTISPECIES: winged helix-turn-helix domain-containing protein [unclassified Enterococcus]MCA5011426.1 winged helix-turn-helix domain-containing protein [Enterococcus sp. S23]MCA5015132.1 winged helix-turn-helix domain-containing protein [Enterococcus sp. S22(2020)]
MFNVAIISNDCGANKKYITEFKSMDFNIDIFSKEKEFEKIDLSNNFTDVFIIEESEMDDLFNTCELIMKIRRNSNAFIWVFSNIDLEKQKYLYFDLGADGVVGAKDEQIIAVQQIRNILNRSRKNRKNRKNRTEQVLESDRSVVLLPENQSIIINSGDEIPLTRLEYQVVSALNQNCGTALTHREIYQIVWDNSYEEEKTVKYRVSNIIFHIRKKLKNDSQYIKTVRSRGYMVTE